MRFYFYKWLLSQKSKDPEIHALIKFLTEWDKIKYTPSYFTLIDILSDYGAPPLYFQYLADAYRKYLCEKTQKKGSK